MPLSAAFCFFSPFHYKKKLLYQPFSLIHFFLLFFLSFHPLVSSLSAPIFVILLNTIKK